MTGRFVFRAVTVLVLIAVAAALGVAAYNIGVNVGLDVAQHVAVQNGQPVPVVPYGYGPYWHGGFGFFGIILWIIGFFLIIGLIRAAFGIGRGGRGGWGRWGGPMGPGGPGGFGGGDRVAESVQDYDASPPQASRASRRHATIGPWGPTFTSLGPPAP